MRCKRTVEIEKDLTNTKKKFTCKALVVAFKRTQGFLPFFQDSISSLETFSGLENCWANFKNSRLCTNPVRSLHPPRETDNLNET